MTAFTDAFVEMAVGLVPAAAQEAARLGHERLEPEHLLLGLLGQGGAGAEVLARHGVTLSAARQAVRDTDRALLAAVGIDAPAPVSALPLEPSDLRWQPVLNRYFKDADRVRKAQRDRHLRSEHLLQALLEDDAGTPAELLRNLGADPDAVRSQLAAAPRDVPPVRRGLAAECFVALPPDAVWPLVADPAHIPSWYAVERVERVEGSGPGELQRWHDRARRGGRVLVERRVERFHPGRAITWRAERSCKGDGPWRATRGWRRFGVELEPVPGGTRIRVAFAGGRMPWWSLPLRPLRRPLGQVSARYVAGRLASAALAATESGRSG